MRNFIVTVFLVIVLSIAISAPAEDGKVSTTIHFKNDSCLSSSSEAVDFQRMFVFWHYQNLGGGIDLGYAGKNDYIQIKPFVTLNKGPWYLVGGVLADNFSQYVHGGFWYTKTIGKTFVLADVRNYFAVEGEADDYADSFLEITHPVGGGPFFIGFDAEHIYWWGSDRNWLFIGPMVGYNFNRNIAAFVRLSREWEILGEEIGHSDKIRLGLILKF